MPASSATWVIVGGMEAVAHEGALGGGEDMRATLLFGQAAGGGEFGEGHVNRGENERSFSLSRIMAFRRRFAFATRIWL